MVSCWWRLFFLPKALPGFSFSLSTTHVLLLFGPLQMPPSFIRIIPGLTVHPRVYLRVSQFNPLLAGERQTQLGWLSLALTGTVHRFCSSHPETNQAPISKQITLHKAAGRRLGGWEARSQGCCFTHVLVNLPSAPREKQTQTSVVNSVHFVPASKHTGIGYNLLDLTSVYPQIKILSRDYVAPREYRNMLHFREIPSTLYKDSYLPGNGFCFTAWAVCI